MYINDCGIPSKYNECDCHRPPAIIDISCSLLLECGKPLLLECGNPILLENHE